ncbi:hypothetical protein ACFDTO_25500 [Microbacteriaceae bacterium 4G12]
MKRTSYSAILGVVYLRNKFTQLYLCSFAILLIGLFEIAFNYTKVSNTEGFYEVFVGAILLIFAITSHVKYNKNRKQLERELSREYDERDDLIEGKASYFTMTSLMIVIMLMMFLSKWITVPTNTSLFIIIIFCAITNTLAKKYYNYVL